MADQAAAPRAAELQRSPGAGAVFAQARRLAPVMLARIDVAERRRLARFLVVGVVNTAFGYAVLLAALALVRNLTAALAITTVLGVLFNFVSTGRLVFRSTSPGRLWRFACVYGLIFVYNDVVLHALERVGVAPRFGGLIALPGAVAISYLLNRSFVFGARGGGRIDPVAQAAGTRGLARSLAPTNRWLLAFASGAFIAPDLLLAMSLRPLPGALVAAGCIGAMLLILRGGPTSASGLLARPIEGRRLAACMALALGLLILGGEAHLFYANVDWLTRDAVLADLVHAAKPVYLAAGRLYVLRAPVGMYLTPALVGRALGLYAAHIALLAQNALVLGIALYLLALLGRGWRTLGVLLLFGGLCVVWRVIAAPLAGRMDQLLSVAAPLDQWNLYFQYSSSVTQLFWVPNHALPGWWLAVLLLLYVEREVDAAVIGVSIAALALWSPLAVLTAAPLALAAAPSRLGEMVRAPRTWIGVAVASAFLPVAAYLTLAAGSICHEMSAAQPHFLGYYLIFVIIQLAAAAFIALERRRLSPRLHGLFWASVVILLALPILHYGPNNDLVMRASIPPLTVLAFCFADVLSRLRGVAPGAWRIGLLILAVGSASAGAEVARALTVARYAISDCTLLESARQLDQQGVPTNYVVAVSGVPAWLMSVPDTRPRSTKAGAARACWPGRTPMPA